MKHFEPTRVQLMILISNCIFNLESLPVLEQVNHLAVRIQSKHRLSICSSEYIEYSQNGCSCRYHPLNRDATLTRIWRTIEIPLTQRHKLSMTDPGLRNRFDFGAPASWSTARSNPGPAPQNIPGAYVPDDRVGDIPNIPENVAEQPPPPNATQQNPDKTCRICLSGAEDGNPDVM